MALLNSSPRRASAMHFTFGPGVYAGGGLHEGKRGSARQTFALWHLNFHILECKPNGTLCRWPAPRGRHNSWHRDRFSV